MTKADLKTGMRVTFRNGETAIVLIGCGFSGHIAEESTDVLVNHETKFWTQINSVNPDLTSSHNKSFDIIKIEMPDHPYSVFGDKVYLTVWEISEAKLMTIAEIENKLGYKIKIVG